MTKPQCLPDLASKIREAIRSEDCRLALNDHSEAEMAKDGIDLQDVTRVLKGCKVTNQEYVKSEWRYRAEGKNVDGEGIVLIVNYNHEEKLISLVTAWKVRK